MDDSNPSIQWEDVSRPDAPRAAQFAMTNFLIGACVVSLGLLSYQPSDLAFGVTMVALGLVMILLPMAMWIKARRERGLVVKAYAIELPAVGGFLFIRVRRRQEIPVKEIESFEVVELGRPNRFPWILVLRLKSGSELTTRVGTESVSGLRAALIGLGINGHH